MGRSKAGLFLFELIIVIALFAISSAMCMQLFAMAHNLSEKSMDTRMAIANAVSAAESFKMTGNAAETASMMDLPVSEGRLEAFYDNDWNIVATAEGRYRMIMEVDTGVSPASAFIIVTDLERGEELYRLEVKKFIRAY